MKDSQTAENARFPPMPISLEDALAHVERRFGIARLLADEGHNIIAPYYLQSEPGYKRAHSEKGCMHIALNTDGRFDPDGYYTQIRETAAQMQVTRAGKVLELGSGMGFNTLALAADHSQVSFTGLDLMPHHVANAARDAAALPNTSFLQGSYEDMPDDLRDMDVVFGIETLCYATDLDTVAQGIAASLRPGGRFVMYDGFRRADYRDAPEDVITATRLFEITTAVTNGFWTVEDWEGALTRAGLRILHAEDLTDQSIACMRHLQKRALRFFCDWKYRFLHHVLPRYLVRNAVAGLMGPFMIEGAGPQTGATKACLTYGLVIAEKPG